MSFSPKTRAALLAAAALALCACGRRGDLEPPSAAAPQAENRHDMQVHRPDKKITPPNKDFALDPLLK